MIKAGAGFRPVISRIPIATKGITTRNTSKVFLRLVSVPFNSTLIVSESPDLGFSLGVDICNLHTKIGIYGIIARKIGE